MKRIYWYKLEGVVPVIDLTDGRWMQENEEARQVAFTEITKDVFVSTVFLCIDHNFLDTGKPILFETLVFGGKMDGHMERYETWFQAEQGHQKIVDEVRNTIL